jgi:2-phosphosulfolactate phosphatase
MEIDVFLTPNAITEKDVRNRQTVVIDVLRASSTVATALSRGARAIIPAPDMATASRIASNMDPEIFRLGGEQGGIRIEGYHLGNSPFEYNQEAVKNRTIIFKTTNGTGAIFKSKAAKHLIIGCFLNAQRVVDFVHSNELDTVLVCAGWEGRVSFEDLICAGLLLNRIWDGREPVDMSDTARIAHSVYIRYQDQLHEAISKTTHAQRLFKLGHSEDVAYCTQLDVLSVLPYFRDNRLVDFDI